MDKLEKAMEKAEMLREQPGDEDTIFDDTNVESLRETPGPGYTAEDQPPKYRQTKVVRIDLDVLRKNKIVAAFHNNPATDYIKLIRTQVMERFQEIKGRSLLVTSPNGGEGRTLTAINLAASISHKIDNTVLLVDADFKNPAVHKYFGLDTEKGLAEYLQGTAMLPELLINPGIEKLVLLPAGRPPQNSAELLASPRMESLIKELCQRYDDRFIIFDAPDLLSCTDALIISQFIDGVLLVVQAEKTSSKDITSALDLLRERTIIGTVLNREK